MEVMVTISATLLEGQCMADITRADILGCTETNVVCVEPVNDIASRKKYLKDKICKTMCEIMCMDTECLTQKSRKQEVVSLRFSVALVLRRTGRFGYREIGEILGGRDHTTAVHAVKTAKNRIVTLDEKFEPYRLAIIKTEEIINL